MLFVHDDIREPPGAFRFAYCKVHAIHERMFQEVHEPAHFVTVKECSNVRRREEQLINFARSIAVREARSGIELRLTVPTSLRDEVFASHSKWTKPGGLRCNREEGPIIEQDENTWMAASGALSDNGAKRSRSGSRASRRKRSRSRSSTSDRMSVGSRSRSSDRPSSKGEPKNPLFDERKPKVDEPLLDNQADLVGSLKKILGLEAAPSVRLATDTASSLPPRESYGPPRATMPAPVWAPRKVQPKKPDFGYSLDRSTLAFLATLPPYIHVCRDQAQYFSAKDLSFAGHKEQPTTVLSYFSIRAPEALPENLYNHWNPQLMRRVQDKFNFKLEHVVWLQQILIEAQVPLRRPVGLIHFDKSVQDQVEVAVILELVDQVLMPPPHLMRPQFRLSTYAPVERRAPGRDDMDLIRYLDTPPPSPPPEPPPPLRRRTPILQDDRVDRYEEDRLLPPPFPSVDLPAELNRFQFGDRDDRVGLADRDERRSQDIDERMRRDTDERVRPLDRDERFGLRQQPLPSTGMADPEDILRENLLDYYKQQGAKRPIPDRQSDVESPTEKRRRLGKLVDVILATSRTERDNAVLQLLVRVPNGRELVIDLALRQPEALANLVELIKDPTLKPHSPVVLELEKSLLNMARDSRSRSIGDRPASRRSEPSKMKRKRRRSSSSSSSSSSEDEAKEKERKVEQIMGRVEEMRKKMKEKLAQKASPVTTPEVKPMALPVPPLSMPGLLGPPPVPGLVVPIVPPMFDLIPGLAPPVLPILTGMPPPTLAISTEAPPPTPVLEPPGRPPKYKELKEAFWKFLLEYTKSHRETTVCEEVCTAFSESHSGFRHAVTHPSANNSQFIFMLTFDLNTVNGSGKNMQEAFLDALCTIYTRDTVKTFFLENATAGFLLFGTKFPEEMGLPIDYCVKSIFSLLKDYVKEEVDEITTADRFVVVIVDFSAKYAEFFKISIVETRLHPWSPSGHTTEFTFSFGRPVRAIGRSKTKVDSMIETLKNAFGFTRLREISAAFWPHVSENLKNRLKTLAPDGDKPQPHNEDYWPTYFVTSNCVPASAQKETNLHAVIDDSCTQMAMYIRSFGPYKGMTLLAFEKNKEKMDGVLTNSMEGWVTTSLFNAFQKIVRHYLLHCCQPLAPNPGIAPLVDAIKTVLITRSLWGDPCENSFHHVLTSAPRDDIQKCLRGMLCQRKVNWFVTIFDCLKAGLFHPSYRSMIPHYFPYVVDGEVRLPPANDPRTDRKPVLLDELAKKSDDGSGRTKSLSSASPETARPRTLLSGPVEELPVPPPSASPLPAPVPAPPRALLSGPVEQEPANEKTPLKSGPVEGDKDKPLLSGPVPADSPSPARAPITRDNPYPIPEGLIEKKLLARIKNYFSANLRGPGTNKLINALTDVRDAKTKFLAILAGNEGLLNHFFDDRNFTDPLCRSVLLEIDDVTEENGSFVVANSVSDFIDKFVYEVLPDLEKVGPMKSLCSKFELQHLRTMLIYYCFTAPEKAFPTISGVSDLARNIGRVGPDEVKLTYALMHVVKDLNVPETAEPSVFVRRTTELEKKIAKILEFSGENEHPVSTLIREFVNPKAALRKVAACNPLLLDNLTALTAMPSLENSDSSFKHLSFKISGLKIERKPKVEPTETYAEPRSPNARDFGLLIDDVFSVLNRLDSKSNALVNLLKNEPKAHLVFTHIAMVDKPLLADLVEKVQWPVFKPDDPVFMKIEEKFKGYTAEESQKDKIDKVNGSSSEPDKSKPVVNQQKPEKEPEKPATDSSVNAGPSGSDRLDQKHKQIELVIDQICEQQKSNPVIKLIREKGDPKKILWDIAINHASSLQKIVSVIREAKTGTLNDSKLRGDVESILRGCSV